jgi:hypothetical protein
MSEEDFDGNLLPQNRLEEDMSTSLPRAEVDTGP